MLFQIFTGREECKATAAATDSPFTEWDKTFADARFCAAIADRITSRCTLVQTGTESYRASRPPRNPSSQQRNDDPAALRHVSSSARAD
ncbi:ATP-binding protein [Streptomyces sp. NPDC056831]|uniref:ATP-binding protein n=1 Tax=Streptomyces sp. NPDC056831 TaxID=3345954 RepID=UPI0036AF2062